MVKRRASSFRNFSSFEGRSAEIAPMTSFPIFIGTQIKAMSLLLRCFLEPVLSRKRGSSEILGIIAGLPVLMTLPVMPSPIRYLPLALSSGRSPYASSITISPRFLFRIVRVPRGIPMCSAVIWRIGFRTVFRSRLSLSLVLISKRRASSLISRDVLSPAMDLHAHHH